MTRRSGSQAAYRVNDPHNLDIGRSRIVHTDALEVDPYHYKLPCFCGAEIKLIPEDGQSAKCPAECGGVAQFADGRAHLELVDA